MVKNRLIIGAILLLAVLAGISFSQSYSASKAVKALRYPSPKAIPEFSLTRHDNSAFDNQALEGHWSFIFLGYTHCPDICPTTMARLSGVYQKLQDQVSEPVQVVLVSADPKRDTPERLAQYVQYFRTEFVGATAEHKVLFPFTRSLGLVYSMGQDTSQADYAVDHSASLVLVGPDARVHAVFKPEFGQGKLPLVNMNQLVDDFKILSQS